MVRGKALTDPRVGDTLHLHASTVVSSVYVCNSSACAGPCTCSLVVFVPLVPLIACALGFEDLFDGLALSPDHSRCPFRTRCDSLVHRLWRTTSAKAGETLHLHACTPVGRSTIQLIDGGGGKGPHRPRGWQGLARVGRCTYSN